jgi:uncharacterized protein
MALNKDVRISLRLNIDRTNVTGLKELNAYFDKLGWTDNPNFHVGAAVVDSIVENPKHMSKSELVRLTMALKQSFNSSIISYEKTARDVLRRCFSEGYPFNRVANCAAESGMFIFDPLGNIYTCWEELGEVPNRIATYDDKGIKFNRDVVLQWLTRFPGAIEQCSTCQYALIHTSGCAKHARNTSGTMFSAACESFKEYFPQTLAQCYQEIEGKIFGRDEATHSIKHLPVIN